MNTADLVRAWVLAMWGPVKLPPPLVNELAKEPKP